MDATQFAWASVSGTPLCTATCGGTSLKCAYGTAAMPPVTATAGLRPRPCLLFCTSSAAPDKTYPEIGAAFAFAAAVNG